MSDAPSRRGLSSVSIAIGVAGLIGLVALWLTHVHATSGNDVLDCGSVVGNVTTMNTIHGPCRHVLGRRFALAFVVIVPSVVAAWVVQLRHVGYLGGRRIEPRGTPRLDFRVGARVGRGRASYPLARLSATPEQVVIVSPVGSAVMERHQVESISRVGRSSHSAAQFRTFDGSGDRVHVYARDTDRLLAGLAELGWPVT